MMHKTRTNISPQLPIQRCCVFHMFDCVFLLLFLLLLLLIIIIIILISTIIILIIIRGGLKLCNLRETGFARRGELTTRFSMPS